MPCGCTGAGLWFAGIIALIFLPHWIEFVPYVLVALAVGFVALVAITGMVTHWRKTGKLGWQP